MTAGYEKYTYPTCDWEAQGGWSLVAFTLFLIWKWMWAYLVMVQVCFVSGCVAQFNFDRSLVTKSMPLTLIKLAFTKSAGTVGKSALVLQFIDFVKRNSKVSCRNCATCCCTWPVLVVACILRCCCITCLEMMNKFVLIFHVITGDEFWKSATRSYKLMKKAGLDALVMETAALNTFVIIGYGLSLGVGVCLRRHSFNVARRRRGVTPPRLTVRKRRSSPGGGRASSTARTCSGTMTSGARRSRT